MPSAVISLSKIDIWVDLVVLLHWENFKKSYSAVHRQSTGSIIWTKSTFINFICHLDSELVALNYCKQMGVANIIFPPSNVRGESAMFINSREAIADAIIGLLLVFYDSKRSIGFLQVFFNRKYCFFRLRFDLIVRVSKIAVFEREKFFVHALRSVNDFLTLKTVFERCLYRWQFLAVFSSICPTFMEVNFVKFFIEVNFDRCRMNMQPSEICHNVSESLVIRLMCKIGPYF